MDALEVARQELEKSGFLRRMGQLTMNTQPIHLLCEPRPNTAAEQERGWLGEVRKRLRAELDEIAKGSEAVGWPDHLENAISNLEAACDNLRRRMAELDEGTA